MIASDRQHTLANEIVLEGIGLHTGENAQLRIAAGDINTGYVFVRKDLEGEPGNSGARFERVRNEAWHNIAQWRSGGPHHRARARFTLRDGH